MSAKAARSAVSAASEFLFSFKDHDSQYILQDAATYLVPLPSLAASSVRLLCWLFSSLPFASNIFHEPVALLQLICPFETVRQPQHLQMFG